MNGRTSKKLFGMIGLLALVLVAASAVDGSAEPILFTYTGTGTGTIGSTPIVNVDFTITALSDTDTRRTVSSGIYYEDHSWASITIDGVGTYEFITGTRTFVNQGVGSGQVGFSRAGKGGYDLYSNLNSSVFDDWAMLTSTELITGLARLQQWDEDHGLVETTGGILQFDKQWTDCTFQATVGAVPEPSTITLLSLGSLCLLGCIWRRRKVV